MVNGWSDFAVTVFLENAGGELVDFFEFNKGVCGI